METPPTFTQVLAAAGAVTMRRRGEMTAPVCAKLSEIMTEIGADNEHVEIVTDHMRAIARAGIMRPGITVNREPMLLAIATPI